MKAKKAVADIYGPEPEEVKTATGRLNTRYVDVTKILPLEENFKRHAMPETKKSILRWGVIDPIGINRTTGKNYDGHGRVEALQAMREDWMDAGKPADEKSPFRVPKGVIAIGETWFVPTVDGVEMSADEAIPAAAALNRINELGGYDEAVMAEVLQQMDEDARSAAGYSEDDFKEIMKRFEGRENLMNDIHVNDPDGQPFGGLQTTAAISNTRQIALILQPEVHAIFIEQITQLSERFKTDNVTDTVLAVVKYCFDEKKK